MISQSSNISENVFFFMIFIFSQRPDQIQEAESRECKVKGEAVSFPAGDGLAAADWLCGGRAISGDAAAERELRGVSSVGG